MDDGWRKRPTNSVSVGAKVLGVAPTTVYEGIKRGEIPAIKVGRRRILSTEWLKRQVDAREVALGDGRRVAG